MADSRGLALKTRSFAFMEIRLFQLRITFFSLETYYHRLPEVYTQDNPIRVYFNNVVIARKYIGPATEESR